ncbi:MAG: hypothetical protein ACXVQT_01890 [Actinomycetota bacterium]
MPGNVSAVMGGSAVYADRIEDDVWLALGDPDGTAAALRSRADQVLARPGDALQAGRSPEERIEALIETYMQGALQLLADAASGDRLAFAEAEITAASVAAAMDRAADAAACGDAENVAAAMASAEALLDLDLADLYDLLL